MLGASAVLWFCGFGVLRFCGFGVFEEIGRIFEVTNLPSASALAARGEYEDYDCDEYQNNAGSGPDSENFTE